VQDGNSNRFALCIDRASSLLKEGGEQPLFKDGEPAEITQKALKFCEALQQQVQITRMIVDSLKENNLLDQHNGEITLNGGEKITLSGFQIVNEKKLAELSDEAFLKLRRNGALSAIHCHLLSMGGWSDLARRASA
jgi:hypothetical protein